MTAALLSFAVDAPSARAATAKAPISGVVDRNGPPATGWESVVNNYVVRVKWSDLQPDAQGEALPANNAIDQAIAAVQAWNTSHTPPEAIKIRVDAGTGAPGWAKNLDGPGTAVAVHDAQDPNNPDTTPDTVGRFWETAFGTAYNDLQSKLAAKYDGVAEVRDVTISRCTLSTVEPFLRTASSQNTKNNLLAAGYTVTADDACQHAQIDEAKAVWTQTPSSLSLNPYQHINADGTDSTDVSYTDSMITYCRSQLGSLCVLENNSIRDPLQTGAYTTMYSAMKTAGAPITFQTAGNSVIGSLCNTLNSAVGIGANSVEIPGGYFNSADITMAGLSSYDKALGRVQPADTTAPSPPANLTATVNSSSSVTLNWQPATDAGYGVACYTVKRNGTFLGTTMATRFSDTGANTLNPTQYTVTANDGAGNFGPAAAKSLTPPITTVSSSASTITYGSTVTFTATVTSQDGGTPTGTVNFYDGTTQIGSGTLSNGQAQFATASLTGGSHSITATYLGDSTFPPSDPSSAITESVNKAASTTALTSSPNPSGFGSPVTLTATVSGPGATATGTATFKDGANVIGSPVPLDGNGQATMTTSSLAIGNHTLSAAYGGDGNYNSSSSASRTQTVTKATTSTGLTSSANPAPYGSAVTLTATVTSAGGTPAGSVTFKSGSTSLGTVTLDGSGRASLTKTFTKVSTAITATYAGNTTFGASASPVFTQTQNNAPATVTLSSSSSAVTAPSSVTFTASVTSTAGTPSGSVTFYEGSTALGPAVTVVSGKAKLTIALPPGGHVITAAYSGDASFSPKTSAALFQKVNHTGGKTSSTAVATSPNPSTSSQTVTITATVTGAGATGTVWFFDGGNVIGSATVDGSGHAVFTTSALSVGSHSLKAGYSGDATFNPSLSTAKTQTVNP